MELPGRRERGRLQRRFIDEVMEDMQRVGVIEEDDGIGWSQTIHCGDRLSKQPEEDAVRKLCVQNVII